MATSLYKDEFPLLEAHGIYAADIRGDGNCLFNALSDQMYGHQDRHHQVRATTIDYMRQHPDTFKAFLEVHPGGGQRRNPRRKTASAYSSANTIATQATPEEIDRVFEEHLRRMAKGGVWGDNMEIVAFSQAYQMSVKIWQREYAYIIDASDHIQEDPNRMCHIAYHSWEHYSSIRNIKGPHTGPPCVEVQELSAEGVQQQQARLQAAPTVMPWMIHQVASCVSHFNITESDIIRAIEESKNNIDQAVNKLYEIHDPQSMSSQQSSSVERESERGFESDGDASTASGFGTNKRYQASRLNRNTKYARRIRDSQTQMKARQHLTEKLSDPSNSLENLINIAGSELKPTLLGSRRNSLAVVDGSDTDQRSDSLPDPLKDGDTSSGSEYSQPTTVTSSMITIKLQKPEHEPSPQPPQRMQPSSPSRATPPPPPLASAAANPTGVSKQKFVTARAKKEEKKRAQKQKAKERQILAATGGKSRTTAPSHLHQQQQQQQPEPPPTIASSSLTAPDMARSTSHPSMTTAIKTLYI